MYRVQPYTRPDTGHCPAAPRAPASAVRAPAPGIAPRQCSVSQSVVGSSDVARRSSRRRTFVRVSASHSPIVLPIQPPRVAASQRAPPTLLGRKLRGANNLGGATTLWRWNLPPPCLRELFHVCGVVLAGKYEYDVQFVPPAAARIFRARRTTGSACRYRRVFGSRVFRSFYAFRHAAQMYTLYTVVVTRRSRRLDQPTIQIVLAQWRHTRTPAVQMSDHASPIKMASPTAMSFAATHCKHAPLSFGATMWAFSLAPSEVVSWSSSGRSAGPSMLSSNL